MGHCLHSTRATRERVKGNAIDRGKQCEEIIWKFVNERHAGWGKYD